MEEAVQLQLTNCHNQMSVVNLYLDVPHDLPKHIFVHSIFQSYLSVSMNVPLSLFYISYLYSTSIYISIFILHLSLSLFYIYLSIYLTIYPSLFYIYLSISLSICLYIYLICLFSNVLTYFLSKNLFPTTLIIIIILIVIQCDQMLE